MDCVASRKLVASSPSYSCSEPTCLAALLGGGRMRQAGRKDSNIHAAAFGAATLIAGQVAGKAVRDAFFLSRFEVSALPDMTILAALVSIAAGFVAARMVHTIALTRLVPIAFAGSSVLLLLEWWIAAWNPGLAAIAIYLQMA